MESIDPGSEFLEILEEHQGILHKISRLYTNTREDQKDLFQEMLFQLWKAYPAFKGESKISTWMYTVCFHTAMNTLKKYKRKSFVSFDFLKHDSQKEEAIVFEDEQLNELHRAIAGLNEVESAIMMLYLEEKSYDEIAQITGLTLSNVGVRINRIKSKLEKKLNHLNQ